MLLGGMLDERWGSLWCRWFQTNVTFVWCFNGFFKNISCFTPIVKEEFGLAFTTSRSVPVDRSSFWSWGLHLDLAWCGGGSEWVCTSTSTGSALHRWNMVGNETWNFRQNMTFKIRAVRWLAKSWLGDGEFFPWNSDRSCGSRIGWHFLGELSAQHTENSTVQWNVAPEVFGVRRRVKEHLSEVFGQGKVH